MENQLSEQTKRHNNKFNLSNIFSQKKKTDEVVNSQQNIPGSSQSLRTGETYTQWGARICGIVEGRVTALPPYLHKVYDLIYNEQANNIHLQESANANTQAEIDRKNEDIRIINENIEEANQNINNFNNKIEELKEEKQEIKTSKEKINKEQKLKLIIGLIIIIPLTFYLFLFYSSTFYSAFFRATETITSLMNSMFDSNAIPNAFEDGVTELGFILSAPIIFLGLGFSLHFFFIQKEKSKYLKMLGILIVTVMFDCILAYKIGEQIHNVGILTGQRPIGEEYTIDMAFHDINTWAVIFCGFIVYVIWGIVFDMCMSAYNSMDLNKTRLMNIDKEIAELNNKIKKEKSDIQNLKQKELQANKDIKDLMAKLVNHVYINYNSIKKELNNFFAGWIKMMQVLSISIELQDESTNIYKREIEAMIPKK